MPRILLLLLTLVASTRALLAADAPIPVKVVVLAMFEVGEDQGDRPGEYQLWVEREKLTRTWAFHGGHPVIRGTEDGAIIATVTGMGTARAAATVMALGLDPRFDLSRAYWLVAGIAGIDPHDGTIGSAVWADWIVDGDLAHEIDPREMPKDWSTGYIPLRRSRPYEGPADRSQGQGYLLNRQLSSWAYGLTKDIQLMDTEGMEKRRQLYQGFPKALEKPKVMRGDTMSGMTYWHGKLLNEWANEWVRYTTDGDGQYVTTAMEDTGTLQSLTYLASAGKVDLERVLVLRTASNFDMQWPGGDAAESLSGEKLDKGYSAYLASLDAAHRVGSTVVHALVKDWERYSSELPKP